MKSPEAVVETGDRGRTQPASIPSISLAGRVHFALVVDQEVVVNGCGNPPLAARHAPSVGRNFAFVAPHLESWILFANPTNWSSTIAPRKSRPGRIARSVGPAQQAEHGIWRVALPASHRMGLAWAGVIAPPPGFIKKKSRLNRPNKYYTVRTPCRSSLASASPKSTGCTSFWHWLGTGR